MSIKKTLGRVGIVLSVAVMVVCGGGSGGGDGGVKIGNQTWTKQNLNVKTPDSWCYESKNSNCAKYGRLYTLEAAKKACASMGGKWRLPTEQDWDNLLDYAGGFSVAGKKFKSKSGWNGTDDYGFSAMPGGYRNSDGDFDNAGGGGDWWSATEDGGDAYYLTMRSDGDDVYKYLTPNKSNGFSVRCVGAAQ